MKCPICKHEMELQNAFKSGIEIIKYFKCYHCNQIHRIHKMIVKD